MKSNIKELIANDGFQGKEDGEGSELDSDEEAEVAMTACGVGKMKNGK